MSQNIADQYRRWFDYEKDSHAKVFTSLEAVNDQLSKVEIPPTVVGGWFRSDLQKRYQSASLIPLTAVGGYFRSSLAAAKTLAPGGI